MIKKLIAVLFVLLFLVTLTPGAVSTGNVLGRGGHGITTSSVKSTSTSTTSNVAYGGFGGGWGGWGYGKNIVLNKK